MTNGHCIRLAILWSLSLCYLQWCLDWWPNLETNVSMLKLGIVTSIGVVFEIIAAAVVAMLLYLICCMLGITDDIRGELDE